MDGQEAAFFDDDEPARPLLPPEDRLWRHPSELAMFPPPRRRHRPSLSPLVIAPLVVVGVAGALIIAVVVAGPSTTRGRSRPSDAASVVPLTVSSIVAAVTPAPTVAPSPTTTAVLPVTTVATATTTPTTTPTTKPLVAVAARPSGHGMLGDGSVNVPAVDLHDRFVVAAFDTAPSADASWTFTDDVGVARTAQLVGYVAAVRVAVLSVDADDAEAEDPSSGSELPKAPWADEAPVIGAAITIGERDGVLLAVGSEPNADGLALEHALVAGTATDSDRSDPVTAATVSSSTVTPSTVTSSTVTSSTVASAAVAPSSVTPPTVTSSSVTPPPVTSSTVAPPGASAAKDPSVGDLVWSDGKILGLVVHVVDGQVLVIPSNLVKAAAASVIGGGSTDLAWLGVSVSSDDQAEIVVSAVNSSSPAADIGLRVGDVVTSLNGSDITSPAELVAAVWRCGTGHAVEITVIRNGVTSTLVGELAAMPVNV